MVSASACSDGGRAASSGLGVIEQDQLAFAPLEQAQIAELLEIAGQGLGHRADLRGDHRLLDVEIDDGAVPPVQPVAVGVDHQVARQAGDHLLEDDGRVLIDEAAQPQRLASEQCARDLDVALDQLEERPAWDLDAGGLLQGLGACRIGLHRKHRHLGEALPGLDHVQDLLAAIGAAAVDLHLAPLDEEEGRSRLTLGAEHLVLLEVPALAGGGERGELHLLDGGEEGKRLEALRFDHVAASFDRYG